MFRRKIVVVFALALLTLVVPIRASFYAVQETNVLPLWTYGIDSASYGGAAVDDIDNDGKLELVFGTHIGDEHLYALNAEDGSLLWKFWAGPGPIDSSVRLYDINDDDQLEVIFTAYDSYINGSGILYVLHGNNGSIVWDLHLDTYSRAAPAIADIDEDQEPEIILGTSRNQTGGYVYIINGEDGSIYRAIGPFDGHIHSSPAVLDLDGHLDFVIAMHDGDDRIYAINGTDFSTMWAFQAGASFSEGCSFADIDYDCIQELVIGSQDGIIHAINGEDGSKLWSYKGRCSYYTTSIVNVDDGNPPRIVAIGSSELIVLKGDGEPSWGFYLHPDDPERFSFTQASISDLDGNDGLDVLFCDTRGRIEARNCKYGGIILICNVSEGIGSQLIGTSHCPIIADLDGDNYLDIFVVGGVGNSEDPSENHGMAYALKGEGGTGDGWYMHRHDIRNSGCFERYQEPVWIAGHVRDYYNHTPIVGAEVRTRGGNVSATTHEGGNFSQYLYPGYTTFVVQAEGYEPSYNSVTISDEMHQFLVFSLREEIPQTYPSTDYDFFPTIDSSPTIWSTVIWSTVILAEVVFVLVVIFRKKTAEG